ncbi:MAG: LytR family transcriptional regulator [Actinophytocola sp.]|uniref:LCP family protein n=1 Tax=Actinophytocola sp. TaxID=1872138 RepID=UPI0013267773|nr:LCP family protein [Actinophytocola sp.]MPZ84060.1 LytR family transcriptional regulator [Actinophytocola sp.]
MEERTQVLAAPMRAPSGWRRAGRYTGRTVAALASVAVLGTMGYGWWAVGDVDEGTVTTQVIPKEVEDQRVPLDGAVDMLLVGIDSRTDAYGNPLPRQVLDMLNAGISDGERNTDTMILVHIPVDGTRAIAISFPRDSWVELAGDFGHHRLNSAFAYAYNDARERLANTAPNEKELDAQATVEGRKNLINTVQSLIGEAVTIDRYAEVNLASFYEVTKAIGGVEVCLNQATHDPKSGANFKKGPQTIAGARALAFVRQRYGLKNGDLDRIVRQQAFLGALADKVLSADMLTSPTKVRELVAAVQKSVVLSNGWQLSTFAAQMSGLSSGGIDFYTIPTLGDAKIGGADVLDVDPAQVAAFVKSLTSDGSTTSSTAPPPSDPRTPGTSTTTSNPPAGSDEGNRPSLGLVTVDVQNGSNTTGLAAAVRDSLAQKGFNPGEIGDSGVRDASVIRFAPGERNLAQYAAEELGAPFQLEEDASQPAGRLSIVVGLDYQPPAAGLTGDHLLTMGQPSTSPAAPAAPSSDNRPPPQLNAQGLNCVN